MITWWRERQLENAQKNVNNLGGKQRPKISDGYHTFEELYDHRIAIYIALCKQLAKTNSYEDLPVWRSMAHSDGSVWKDWFILGIHIESGKQITYHLPMSEWKNCSFAKATFKAPAYDNHTSVEVLQRLNKLL